MLLSELDARTALNAHREWPLCVTAYSLEGCLPCDIVHAAIRELVSDRRFDCWKFVYCRTLRSDKRALGALCMASIESFPSVVVHVAGDKRHVYTHLSASWKAADVQSFLAARLSALQSDSIPT